MVAHSVPTHGQRCVAAIRDHLKSTGRHWRELTGEQVAAIIDAMPQDAAPTAELPDKTPRSPRKRVLMAADDEEWLKSLENEPALAGVDVRRELGKMQFWCKGRGFQATRQRFRNWLLKVDRTVTVNGAGQSSRVPALPFGLPEPTGWVEWLTVNSPDCVYLTDGRRWEQLDYAAKTYIRKQMGIT